MHKLERKFSDLSDCRILIASVIYLKGAKPFPPSVPHSVATAQQWSRYIKTMYTLLIVPFRMSNIENLNLYAPSYRLLEMFSDKMTELTRVRRSINAKTESA